MHRINEKDRPWVAFLEPTDATYDRRPLTRLAHRGFDVFGCNCGNDEVGFDFHDFWETLQAPKW